MIDVAYQQLMKHAHRLAMDGHGELAQYLRDAIEEATAPRKLLRCHKCQQADVSMEVTCHNSRCNEYAKANTVYEGWKPVQEPMEFDNSLEADRFKVVRGAFWWHVLIGDSTTEHGKFHSRASAEKMAFDLLREFRNGAFVQREAIRARWAEAKLKEKNT